MASKKNGRKSTAMISPLYESGNTNGPVAGPKGGLTSRDPLGYESSQGQAAPSGSPADRQASSYGERATAR